MTPSGSKIAHSVPDLAAFAGVAREELDPVLTKLADKAERILRPADPSPNRQSVERYEIFHDVLAPAIVDWRTRFMQTLEQAESERQAEAHLKRAEQQAKIAKRLRWLTRAVTAVCLAAIVVAVYAFVKRRQAEASQRQARAALDDKNRETEGRLHAEAATAALQEKASIFKQEAAILRTDLEADDLVMQNAHQGALSKFSRLAQLYKAAQNSLGQAAQNGTDDEKELFKQYRLGEATTYFNMGQIHNDDGNYKEAISFYKKALEIRKEVLGGNDQDVAPILKAMADAYHDSP